MNKFTTDKIFIVQEQLHCSRAATMDGRRSHLVNGDRTDDNLTYPLNNFRPIQIVETRYSINLSLLSDFWE